VTDFPEEPLTTWTRTEDRYPELAGARESFLLLDQDGDEIGIVKWSADGPSQGWRWTLLAVHPGAAFQEPVSGTVTTRGEAVRELRACWARFRKWYGV